MRAQLYLLFRGVGKDRAVASAGAREHDRQADGGQHEEDRTVGRQFGEQIGRATGSKGGLGALATECSGQISRLSSLQEHDANQEKANDYMDYNKHPEQESHDEKLPSWSENSEPELKLLDDNSQLQVQPVVYHRGSIARCGCTLPVLPAADGMAFEALRGLPRRLRPSFATMKEMEEQEAGKQAQTHAVGPVAPEAWVRTELARNPARPYPMDYIETLFSDFSEIHGDRAFGDDCAMTCGMARFHGEAVLVIGNLKGRTLKERVSRRFGSPEPEGYRKALRAMKLAEKYGRPVFTFLDLAGAFPGIGAEERGQGEAIARNLFEMSRLRVPTIATITGEGGSGGALALAVADRVLMLENAIYSVISPEGCASIMWKDAARKQQASAALRYTAKETRALGCVDDVIREPAGGSQADPGEAFSLVNRALRKHFQELKRMSLDDLLARRYDKFRNMAQFYTTA